MADGAWGSSGTPDWYLARDEDVRLRSFISCDPGEWVPDGLLVESGKLVRTSGDSVAMCRHSFVVGVRGIAVDVTYARVMVRVEGVVTDLMRRYEAQHQGGEPPEATPGNGVSFQRPVAAPATGS